MGNAFMDKSYPLGAFVIAFKSAIRSLQLPYHKTFKFAVSHREAGFALKGLLTSSPLPFVACMYQSVLLELHIFGFCYFRFCCCVPPSAHASLAWLVISGCIRIEGSLASSLIGFFRSLACISRYCSGFTLSGLAVFACVVAFLHVPITRAACNLRLHSHWELSSLQPAWFFGRLHVKTSHTADTTHTAYTAVITHVGLHSWHWSHGLHSC